MREDKIALDSPSPAIIVDLTLGTCNQLKCDMSSDYFSYHSLLSDSDRVLTTYSVDRRTGILTMYSIQNRGKGKPMTRREFICRQAQQRF